MLSPEEFEQRYATVEDDNGQSLRSYEDTKAADIRHVWTILDAHDGTNTLYALPGYHVVNTIGYVITEEPWEDESIEAYWFHDEEDEEKGP